MPVGEGNNNGGGGELDMADAAGGEDEEEETAAMTAAAHEMSCLHNSARARAEGVWFGGGGSVTVAAKGGCIACVLAPLAPLASCSLSPTKQL